jgi:hypothetical protein
MMKNVPQDSELASMNIAMSISHKIENWPWGDQQAWVRVQGLEVY